MPPDKYTAIWVSHSSIHDFLNCPRLYFLRNVYKDPATGNKITVMTPPLALGQIVHDVIESLSKLPVDERFKDSPLDKYEIAWKKVNGKLGGFKSESEEKEYKERGRIMIQSLIHNPGPLLNRAVKINQDLPHYWLNEEENIILCGKIDWLEYLPETDGVHIIDFKTSRHEEPEDSLQLPIYLLLATNTQKRVPEKASYWYLDLHDGPKEQKLPVIAEAEDVILKTARRIKLARQLEHFKCPEGGCRYCYPLEQVIKGKGEKVGLSDYRQDIYVL